MKTIDRHYIDGHWTDPTEASQPITNPANGDTTGTLGLGTAQDVDRAVAAARRAFPDWSQTSVAERAAVLRRIADVHQRRLEDMASAITADMGMPIAFARLTVGAGISQFTYYADLIENYAFTEPLGSTQVVKEAIGVCGLIPPWNYPGLQSAEKVAPAIAGGSTVILKPGTPYAGQVLAEIIDEAGVPAGVFNLVNGRGSTVGTALSRHPDVDMIAFTGSTGVGIQVQKDAAETVKRVSLELGGKSAHIVLPDADLAHAAQDAVSRVMNNSGQTCAAPTRTLVPAELYDEFTAHVRAAVEARTVGDPTTPVDMGSVANEGQWHTVQRYIEVGITEGATVAAGGPGRPDGLGQGWFARPTVFSGVTNDMTIAREEIFGPVMCLIPYDGLDDAIAIANDSPYGLAAYIAGTDPDVIAETASRLRAGQVIINDAYPDLHAPFGGYRQSGNGRIWGTAGLEEYLETKAIVR